MKKYTLAFIRRGMIACGIGPLVLAVIYLIMQHHAAVQTLTVHQVCTGIFSLSALAFIAGGMNILYQIERLPLMAAIFIHGCVLYISYLITYLLNDWLEQSAAPILLFTAIFILGYLVIWAIIYTITRHKTKKLNQLLSQRRQDSGSASHQ